MYKSNKNMFCSVLLKGVAFLKKDNFQSPSENGKICYGGECIDIFSEGDNNNFDSVVSSEIISVHLNY